MFTNKETQKGGQSVAKNQQLTQILFLLGNIR